MEQDDRQFGGKVPEGVRGDCRVEEDPSDDCAFIASGDIVVRDMPEMKVLEYLKNGTGNLDIGKTIKDLFVSMKNMDEQLKGVLNINAALEKDIRTSKDVITRLKAERSELENTITTLREEMPSKRELLSEIGHLIEERNRAQASIRSMNLWVENTKSETQGLKERVTELDNEKADMARDINYLEIKLNSALEKLKAYAKEVTVLKGERLSNMIKIENLRKQYAKCVEDKNRLQNLDIQ
jgi:chromosome segregation ATPase